MDRRFGAVLPPQQFRMAHPYRGNFKALLNFLNQKISKRQYR